MTLAALPHATLANVKRGGGVAARAYDGKVSMVRRVGEVSSTGSWALSGQIQSHAVFVIVVEAYKPGKGGVGSVERKPQKACRSNIIS